MVKLKKLSVFLMPFFFGAAFGMGCASGDLVDSDPKKLYDSAEEDIKGDRYLLALDKLRKVKNKFPYSHYSVDAKLRIADVYFMQEGFAEAAASYETFLELHPKHLKAGYAKFRVGESHFKDTPENIARDLSAAYKARDAFESFVTEFPNDKKIDEAKKKIQDVKNVLARKELYIANFYFREKEHYSAKLRYRKLIRLFPKSSSAKEAQKKLEYSIKYLEKHPGRVPKRRQDLN